MKTHSLQSIQKTDQLTINEKTASRTSGQSRKTILVIITLVITGFLIVKLQQSENESAIVATASVVEKKNTTVKTTTAIKQERRKKETAHPADFIKTKIKWRKNLLGETVVEGSLTNTARLASFKDPVITITWLSKTNTALATTNYPLYEYLGASKTILYKLKVKAPAKYAAIKASVESATSL